ncbi:unnamed protein product [Effrenium voratum]|uniref:Uncharacterized protein n=1 Tax=Effrenium voratum TaxID=2562239 RepID=A0AA36NAQ0_9DINO|nr:unnamed protein product [Effrenium voratum]CAJ1420992.1 unnamed protein product [Effrenium voratum]
MALSMLQHAAGRRSVAPVRLTAPTARRATREADVQSMDTPASFPLWPVATRLFAMRKAVRSQKEAKARMERNLAKARKVKEAEASEANAGDEDDMEDEETEPELDKLEEELDEEDVDEDLEEAEMKAAVAAGSVEGRGFLWETDLDKALRDAATAMPEATVGLKDSGKWLDRNGVLETVLQRQPGRSWQWKVGPEPLAMEDCPNPDGSFVATLAHGLESVVELRGRVVPLASLPKKQRRDLRIIAQPEEVDWSALPPFVPAFQDQRLQELARREGCKFFSSTSSLTGILSRCYFTISQHRGFDLDGLSTIFKDRPPTFSPSTRWATVSYVRRNNAGDAWSLTNASDDDSDANVLMELGKTMEYQLTSPKEEFDARFLKSDTSSSSSPASPGDLHKEDLAYRFLRVGDIMMRSQLDAVHRGEIFDVKTRAVFDVRHDVMNYEDKRKYRITHMLGRGKSFELEIYEMMRNAFMKYSFQARIGRMDGVIVAYHNTVEIFGFQYIPLADMERCIYGGTEAASVAFDLCVQMLQKILQFLTEDSELAATGNIKLRVLSDQEANRCQGNTLDIAAAAVLEEAKEGEEGEEGEEAESEKLGQVRHFRISSETFHGDGSLRERSEALRAGDYVHFTVNEIMVTDFCEQQGVAAEAGPAEKAEKEVGASSSAKTPWQQLQDFLGGVFSWGERIRIWHAPHGYETP